MDVLDVDSCECTIFFVVGFPVDVVQLGRALPPDSDIPDHAAFPLYAPSFTLGVPAGNAPDRNTDAYLGQIETHLEVVARMIEERVDGRI